MVHGKGRTSVHDNDVEYIITLRDHIISSRLLSLAPTTDVRVDAGSQQRLNLNVCQPLLIPCVTSEFQKKCHLLAHKAEEQRTQGPAGLMDVATSAVVCVHSVHTLS